MFNDLLTFIMGSIDLYILIFSRMIGMLFIAPMFSRNNIPATVKVGLSMILSYVILPFVVEQTNINVSSLEFIFLIIKETFTGLCIGLIAQIIFSIFISAGANADIQIGLSMAQMMDASSGAQQTVSGQLLNVFAFLVFLALDIHHLFIKLIVNSFYVLPINSVNTYTDEYVKLIISMYGYIFITSIQLVIPIIIVLFLGNLLLAFMSKVMPQMNVFIVGMPFKIIVGFSIIYFTMTAMKDLITNIFKSILEYMYLFINVI